MYLSRVRIHNFRAFKDLTIDLRTGLNVLVGPNNVGKTAALQAIRMAVGPEGTRGENAWLDEDDFYRAPGQPRANTMSVELRFEGLTEDDRTHFYDMVDFNLGDMAKSVATLRFDASWPDGSPRPQAKRCGGPACDEQPEVPGSTLALLPITYLPALRDAEACLAPGVRSRLAGLLKDLIDREHHEAREQITGIFEYANERLEEHELVKQVKDQLQKTTIDLAGTDYARSAVRAAEARFERILRTLQVQMDGAPIASLDANGLGYNNLLYIAVVLQHLETSRPGECPILMVEEPEAHLHPQLTALLADHLAKSGQDGHLPQTIVTTHSPVLTSRIPPSALHLVHVDPQTKLPRCHAVALAGLGAKEERALQRMLDITRASLFFAKGVLLVEGVSEALLVPVMARVLGHDLAKLHISVIPICGVSFGTFRKLLVPDVLGIPVAVVTDGDPPVIRGADWKDDRPTEDGDGNFVRCDRTVELYSMFANSSSVGVYSSAVTLEYDLAGAGETNAALMAAAWEDCFVGKPKTFSQDAIGSASTLKDKALSAWRGICRAGHTGSKADLAHMLAQRLEDPLQEAAAKQFAVPAYLADAIQFVIDRSGTGPQETPVATQQ